MRGGNDKSANRPEKERWRFLRLSWLSKERAISSVELVAGLALRRTKTGLLAAKIPEVVQTRLANMAARDDLDLLNTRRVRREDSLYADSVGDLPNGEGCSNASTGASNDDALKNLDTLFLTLTDAEVNLDGVACAEFWNVAKLGIFDGGDLWDGVAH